MCTPSHQRSYASERIGPSRSSVTEGFGQPAAGYHDDMGLLIVILVVLAIIALVLFIARRSRV
jgi:hypothetical protein